MNQIVQALRRVFVRPERQYPVSYRPIDFEYEPITLYDGPETKPLTFPPIDYQAIPERQQ